MKITLYAPFLFVVACPMGCTEDLVTHGDSLVEVASSSDSTATTLDDADALMPDLDNGIRPDPLESDSHPNQDAVVDGQSVLNDAQEIGDLGEDASEVDFFIDDLPLADSSDAAPTGDGIAGDTSATDAFAFTPASPGPLLGIYAGTDTTCVWDKGQKVYCWGSNKQRKILPYWSKISDSVFVPVATEIAGVVSGSGVAGYSKELCAFNKNGQVVCWGDLEYLDICIPDTMDPMVVTEFAGVDQLIHGGNHIDGLWKNGDVLERGKGTTLDECVACCKVITTKLHVEGAIYLNSNDSDSCAVTEKGAVYCWGTTSFLFDGTATEAGWCGSLPCWSPVLMTEGAKSVSLSGGSSCYLDFGGQVHCWGKSYYGELGTGILVDQVVGAKQAVVVSGLADVVAIHGSGGTQCVLESDGEVRCWGEGSYGKLGNGKDINSAVPEMVLLPGPAAQISVGVTHACALLVNGEAWCWGTNYSGQLGDGTTVNSFVPVKVKFGM